MTREAQLNASTRLLKRLGYLFKLMTRATKNIGCDAGVVNRQTGDQISRGAVHKNLRRVFCIGVAANPDVARKKIICAGAKAQPRVMIHAIDRKMVDR